MKSVISITPKAQKAFHFMQTRIKSLLVHPSAKNVLTTCETENDNDCDQVPPHFLTQADEEDSCSDSSSSQRSMTDPDHYHNKNTKSALELRFEMERKQVR